MSIFKLIATKLFVKDEEQIIQKDCFLNFKKKTWTAFIRRDIKKTLIQFLIQSYAKNKSYKVRHTSLATSKVWQMLESEDGPIQFTIQFSLSVTENQERLLIAQYVCVKGDYLQLFGDFIHELEEFLVEGKLFLSQETQKVKAVEGELVSDPEHDISIQLREILAGDIIHERKKGMFVAFLNKIKDRAHIMTSFIELALEKDFEAQMKSKASAEVNVKSGIKLEVKLGYNGRGERIFQGQYNGGSMILFELMESFAIFLAKEEMLRGQSKDSESSIEEDTKTTDSKTEQSNEEKIRKENELLAKIEVEGGFIDDNEEPDIDLWGSSLKKSSSNAPSLQFNSDVTEELSKTNIDVQNSAHNDFGVQNSFNEENVSSTSQPVNYKGYATSLQATNPSLFTYLSSLSSKTGISFDKAPNPFPSISTLPPLNQMAMPSYFSNLKPFTPIIPLSDTIEPLSTINSLDPEITNNESENQEVINNSNEEENSTYLSNDGTLAENIEENQTNEPSENVNTEESAQATVDEIVLENEKSPEIIEDNDDEQDNPFITKPKIVKPSIMAIAPNPPIIKQETDPVKPVLLVSNNSKKINPPKDEEEKPGFFGKIMGALSTQEKPGDEDDYVSNKKTKKQPQKQTEEDAVTEEDLAKSPNPFWT